jgi:hypothetical protein
MAPLPRRRRAPWLPLVALAAVAACAKPESGLSPPGGDAAPDAVPRDAGAPQADARPEPPQGHCQLTTEERSLGPVPPGGGNVALAWDGARVVTVYQVVPDTVELRFAASDGSLNPLGPVATFTQGLVDCSLSVAPCHGAPVLWVDGPNDYAVAWAGYDPGHGALGLYFGHLDGNGTLSGPALAAAGGADPVAAPDLLGAGGSYLAAWQQGPSVRAATLDAAGLASGLESVSSPAETAERPLLAVAGDTTGVLYTWKTGADAGKLVLRLRPAGGAFGAEIPLDLGLARTRGVALLPLGTGFVVVLEAAAPAGHGWNAAYVAVVDGASGALLSGPDPALLAGPTGGVIVESGTMTNVGDIAIGATLYDADGAQALLQRVNRWGQALHPAIDLSAGHPSVAPIGLGTLVTWTDDRYAVAFVAATTAETGALYLRTVTCDF